MSRVLFYTIVKPLSRLPLPLLYLFSDLMYVIVYRMVGFRKKVVWNNLCNAFPDQSPAELKAVMRAFYSHFCDLIVESIRMFSMTEEEARRRCIFRNPEMLKAHYQAGKGIVLVTGHYNSWEMAVMIMDMCIPHQTVGIYAPLSNSFFEKKINESRGKYGMVLVSKNDIQEYIDQHQTQRNLYVLAADQSPTYAKKVYWTNFLHQETAVAFGPEKFAKKYDMPVVYCHIYKLRRG
ncbi:MAG TPA: lysophospholipid acyltransferase family protein, partial [Saprospiraceae bacterium]|nr:lysophospholipid acyltransferase family protein [Saprospiraceae bacterium]